MIDFPIILKGYAIFNPATGLGSKGGTDDKWGQTLKIFVEYEKEDEISDD